jgi:hypothetical protein
MVEYPQFLSGNTNPFKVKLENPITNIDTKLFIELFNISFYYSVPNVDVHNNIFRYTCDGKEWVEFNLPTGAYEIKNIVTAIKNHLKLRLFYKTNDISDSLLDDTEDTFADTTTEDYFNIDIEEGTMRARLRILNKNFQIDFGCKNSIGKKFGFSSLYQYGKDHISEDIIMISDINSILVNCNLIQGGFVNGKRAKSIYSISEFDNGYKVNIDILRPLAYHINDTLIHEIEIWLTDENLNVLNMNHETISIFLNICTK